jgi:hypothetical protein
MPLLGDALRIGVDGYITRAVVCGELQLRIFAVNEN